jgi:hypothetical protein
MVNKFLYPNGGSETYIFKLSEYFESIGHEVQFFGMEHEGRCVGNNAEQYTADMDFHGGSKLDKLTYPIKTIYSSEARQKLLIVLKDFQPEVVHLNNINFQLTPSVILAVKDYEKFSGRKVRIIMTAHDEQLVCPNHLMFTGGVICEKCLGGKYLNCVKNRCIHGSAAKSLVGAAEGYYWKMRKAYEYIDAIVCPTEFLKSSWTRTRFLRTKRSLFRILPSLNRSLISKKRITFYTSADSAPKRALSFCWLQRITISPARAAGLTRSRLALPKT